MAAIPFQRILDRGPHAGQRRRRGVREFVNRRVGRSGRLLQRLVVIGTVLSLEKARPGSLVSLD